MRARRPDIADFGHRCRRAIPVVVAVAIALVAARDPAGLAARGAAPQGPAAPFAPAPPTLPALPEAPRGTLAVVVTEAGAPIAGAEVAITDGSRAVLASVRTDATGVATLADLAPGPYEVWAIRDAGASPLLRLELGTTAERVELALAPASRVRGTIAIEGDAPAAGRVHLVPLDVDHAVRVVELDELGRFDVAGLPHGRWRVDAEIAGHVLAEETTLTAREAETTLALRLVPAGTVTGTVVDADGNPVANATLVLRDAAGTPLWSFAVAGEGTRWIHPIAGTRELPRRVSTRFGGARAGSRPAECGRGHCGVDLGRERGHIVHAIADGVIARLVPENKSDAGRFVVVHHGGGLRSMYMHLDELRPGLEVGHPVRAGEPIAISGSTGIVRSAPHLHFALTQEHRGRTWYVDPEPILRHAVVLAAPRAYEPVLAAAPTTTAPALDVPPAVARFTTDARGAFRIDGVAPGTYVAVAFAPDLAPGSSEPLEIRGGETTGGIVVTLRTGAVVKGRVLGPAGAIAHARVTASTGDGASAAKIATTATDRHGAFTLRALDGRVTFTVQAQGFTEAERTIVVAGERRHDETFTLTIEDAQIRGQLLAPDGGAAAGVAVRVVEGTSRRSTITDAQGRFVLEPVASGRYVLELSSAEYPKKRVSVDTTRWMELRLERGGSLRTQVRGAGEPLTGVRIALRGPGGQTMERTTDARGMLELRGLAAGTWKLSVRATGYTPGARTVAVRAGVLADDVVLDLARAATIAGVVRDRFGRRVAGARVTIGGVATTTDADGAFRIADAPSGDQLLEAEHDGTRAELPLELPPGGERLTLEVELR